MSNSVRPHTWQPTWLCRTWDSPGKNTGLGANFLLQCMKMKSKSEVTQSCSTLRATPWTAAHQAPLSTGLPRQEYWSGLPLTSPNEAGQRLIEFCQENALVIANTLFQQHKRKLYTGTSPDGQH